MGPAPGAGGGQPCPSHRCVPGRRPCPPPSPSPEMRTGEGASGSRARGRRRRGRLAPPHAAHAVPRPCGRGRRPPPSGPRTHAAPAWTRPQQDAGAAGRCHASRSACPLSLAVTLQGPEGPGPDASQGAGPPPTRGWDCGGALGGLGRSASAHLSGASAGGCVSCSVLLRRPRNAAAHGSCRLVSRWRQATLLVPPGHSCGGARRAGYGAGLSPGGLPPGGPRRHAHLQARACHRGCPTHRRPDLTRTAPRRDGAGPPGSVWARGRKASPAPGSQQHAGCRHGARGFPLRLRARGGARPQLRCVLTPPAALPAQERFRGSGEPQVQRGGRLHPSPWVGPGGGHRIGCWPRAEARPGRRRASAGPASGSLFNLNVSWKAARWARVPGCAHRARDALGPDSQRWPRSGGPLALADRLDAAASRQARGVAGSLESGRWLCSATSRLPGGPSAAGHLPASQRGPRRQEGEGASVGPAWCPGGSAFRAPREETQRMCRSGSRWHGTFQTLKCFNRRHPEPCPAVPSAATLTRPGHGPSWCWRGPGQRSSHPKHGAIH